MMYSATLLASLLASAHGFASTPTDGVECTRYDEYPEYDPKHFVYSVDQSLLYSLVASLGGPDFTSDVSVTRGLVGNTWQGLQLSITYDVDNTTITQAGGKPLTVTSPNTMESGGFNVLSEDFCLAPGEYTIRMPMATHPEMASYNATAPDYLTLEERLAPGAPINTVPLPQAIRDWALEALYVDVYNFQNKSLILSPFAVLWAIFPAKMRAEAEEAAARGAFGMSFIEDNRLEAWNIGEVDVGNGRTWSFGSCRHDGASCRQDCATLWAKFQVTCSASDWSCSGDCKAAATSVTTGCTGLSDDSKNKLAKKVVVDCA